MSATARKPSPTTSKQLSTRDTAPAGRFGAFDRKSQWVGRPEERGSDDVVLDPALPKDLHRVSRIQSGVMSLHQAGRISDAEVVAASRWHLDWSVGTGHPLRASEICFLRVSLGGAGSADGVPVSQLDAASRHRNLPAVVGKTATERLMTLVCWNYSLGIAVVILGVTGTLKVILLYDCLNLTANHGLYNK